MRRIFGKTATMLTVAMALALVAALACGAADEEAVATEVPGATVAPAADTAVPDAPVAVVQPTEAPMEEAEAGKYVPAPQVPGVYWDWRYTGPAPTTFQENPKFAELVKQGKLPPVEQRISDEPKVSAAPGGIGTYGGIFRNSGAGWLFPVIRNSMLYKRNSDEGTKIPHMMFWEVSDDGRVYTMRLRKGVKWGDGDPMDMEDVRFAWEDVNFNETLNPQLSPEWYDKVSGNRVKFAVVDDLHWSLTFETPDFSLMEALSTGNEACTSFCWWGASHYLKPYHEDYASAADITKAMGEFEAADWVSLWKLVNNKTKINRMPNTSAVILSSNSATLNTWDANPYYFVVDPEGNQTPYWDGAMVVVTASREVGVFRGMSGETDLLSNGFTAAEIPLYRSNMERGDYRILSWPAIGGTDYGASICQTCNTDPEIGKWMRTYDFRQALSQGIDREAIVDSILLGQGVAKNWGVHPSSAYYPGDEWAFHNTKYDPDKANALLDGLGLTAKDDDGFRLRSDGSGERLSLASVSHIGAAGDIMELEQDYLHLIGIELKNKPMNGPHTLGYPGKEYMLFMEGNFGLYTSNPWLASWTHAAPVGGGPPWAPDIGALDRSMKVGPAGATITEGGYTPRCDCPISDVWLPTAPANTYPADPSGTILRLIELHTMGKLVTQFSPERIAFGKEINQIHGDQKFFLAVAGHTGSFRGIVFNRTNFLNAPDTNVPSIVGFYSELNYFVDGKDNLSD